MRLFPVVLFLLGVTAEELVFTRRSDNLPELNNYLGQTPCTLCDQIMSPCQSSPFRRVLRTRYNAVPTTCSCNNVFFNLWGACLLSQTNTSNLPTFGDWASNCTNRSINLTVGSPNNSVHVPSWAFASVSGNSTFNVDEALSGAFKSLLIPFSPHFLQSPRRKAGQQCKYSLPLL